MASQLKQVRVDVGSQQVQACQSEKEPDTTIMEKKVFPMLLNLLHAPWPPFFL